MTTTAPHPRNTLNALSGGQFLYSTRTVIQTAYPKAYGHAQRKAHGANKPPQLMAHVIEIFTKPGMHVLDPMAGVGGTLIGSVICESGPRYCDGIEISQKWVDIYENIAVRGVSDLENGRLITYGNMFVGDSIALLQKWESRYDFIAFDPPYNIHLEQTMVGKSAGKYKDAHANRRTDYDMRSLETGDVANVATYTEYLNMMQQLFVQCYRVLREGRYMCFLVTNSYQDGTYNFTHVDLAREAQRAGFVPKGEIVWVPAGKLLRPYGYPYQWIPNMTHTTIVVMRKPISKRIKTGGKHSL